MTNTKQRQIIQAERRAHFDFYTTPAHITEALLKHESFSGDIWEPACGRGDISKVLIDAGHNVYSSDIVDRGYGETHDFFTSQHKADNIITNPPYLDNLHLRFAAHSLFVTTRKTAMLLPLSFFETQRRAKFMQASPLKAVHIFANRVFTLKNGDDYKPANKTCFCWFVWDKQYKGKCTINWIT